MKKLLALAAILVQANLFAQHSGPQARIFGKITDDQGKAIANVSVRVIIEQQDNKGNSSYTKGVTTKSNGQFDFTALPAGEKISIKICGIGYEPLVQDISFAELKSQTSSSQEKNLGEIVLKSSIMELQGVAYLAK
ncbi:MAG: carboxypeptidase regulatory-like domain-containing protein [Bacteroidetes bacterium]|nr:carboxypeptidase regulatory-like domain-containing protein [Bacteroidota bacterium]